MPANEQRSSTLGSASGIVHLTRNRRSLVALCVVSILAAVLLLFAANAGRILVVDDPQRADLIVVLAGETNYRPARALQLLDQGYARRMILNVPTNSTLYKFTQLQIAQKYVQDLPQAASIDICPIQGLSTLEESLDVQKCLSSETGTRILIVTSDYHTRRSLSIFRHEIPGKMFSTAAVTDGTQFGQKWWQHRQWAKTCFDEWLRLLWWNAMERWR
jgi:uncharacterized SAM-binding protein YcdF (DUF218 family)